MRHNEHDLVVGHFLQLILGYAGLQGKKMLWPNAVGLVDNLAPTVFAGRLGSEHCQILGWELEIMITFCIGKKEVGLLVILGDGLLLEDYLVNDSWIILENANILGRL